MATDRELVDVLVDMIVDYLRFIADSETLNQQNLRFTVNELRVMSVVYRQFQRHEPCNLTYLIEETGISRPTASRVLTTLFGYGLIREETDSDDRRVRRLYPGRTGETSMARVATWLDSWAEEVGRVARGEAAPSRSG